jgi:hypothetical protein
MMGIENKRRLKEQYGRDAVVAYEQIQLGATIAPAASGPTALADAQGVASYTTRRPAKLDGITLQVSTPLTAGSGTVRVRALVNGLAVGSGTINAGNAFGDVMFESKALSEVRLAAGDVLVLDVTKGATNVARGLTARAALRLYEL